ncbi:MAG: signal recognition particle-docking protein FtsY [Acidobacteria bacterium]|nr:MAG: signal recognition particle-docking protein FtsY [Acidobacteriota bacterium]
MFDRVRKRLREGLGRTRQAVAQGLARVARPGRRIDRELLDEVEEILVEADLGPELASELVVRIESKARGRTVAGAEELLELVREELRPLLPEARESPGETARPTVVLVAGVNGSGKTTTAGKLAARWAGEGRRVVLAAADTFRAAAVEQLVAWAERAGARIVRAGPGADPAAVAFDACAAGAASGADRVIVDTAGRLHTRRPLMDELTKIARAVGKAVAGAPHETLLVVDGTTGRNAVVQAREFARALDLTGLVVTKLDGTARGGAVIGIGRELGLPVRYVGVGERPEDLLDFDPDEFLSGLLLPPDAEPAAGRP